MTLLQPIPSRPNRPIPARTDMLGNGKVVLLVLVSLPCFGQKIEVGVKGGVPLMNAFETGSFFAMNFGEERVRPHGATRLARWSSCDYHTASSLSSTCSIAGWDSLTSQNLLG